LQALDTLQAEHPDQETRPVPDTPNIIEMKHIRYDKLKELLPNYAVLGDVLSKVFATISPTLILTSNRLNPTFGQGCSKAAKAAMGLIMLVAVLRDAPASKILYVRCRQG
jgi:hypothetical protein